MPDGERPLRQVTVAGSAGGRCPKCKSSLILLRTPWWSCWDCGHQWDADTPTIIAAVDEAKAIAAELRARATIEVKKLPA